IGTSATLNNIIAAGTYTVTVTNANGCSSITSKTVTVNPIPVAFVSGSSTICAGSSAILSVVGAGTYLWSNGQTSASINVSSAGTYTVTVTANGCNTTGTATIAVVQPSTTMSLS
ncbi:MAG TPA: pectate lyase, partial [Bacteroidia bacterium]|nr:pectate lyase [Bacteroidia bacterium]